MPINQLDTQFHASQAAVQHVIYSEQTPDMASMTFTEYKRLPANYSLSFSPAVLFYHCLHFFISNLIICTTRCQYFENT